MLEMYVYAAQYYIILYVLLENVFTSFARKLHSKEIIILNSLIVFEKINKIKKNAGRKP